MQLLPSWLFSLFVLWCKQCKNKLWWNLYGSGNTPLNFSADPELKRFRVDLLPASAVLHTKSSHKKTCGDSTGCYEEKEEKKTMINHVICVPGDPHTHTHSLLFSFCEELLLLAGAPELPACVPLTPTAETPSVTQKWFIALITRALRPLTNYGGVWHITAFSGNSHHFFCSGHCLYPC